MLVSWCLVPHSFSELRVFELFREILLLSAAPLSRCFSLAHSIVCVVDSFLLSVPITLLLI